MPPATFPEPDVSFVNLRIIVDPNWHHRATFLAQAPGGLDGLTIVFCDMADEGLSESVGVTYATTDVLGRSEQYHTYTGNGNRTLSFTFHFVAQGEPDSPGLFAEGATYGPLAEVVTPVRWLEACKQGFADPGTKLGIAPPPLILTVGNLFAGRVVLSQATPKWMGPFEPGSMYPHFAEVSCEFTVLRTVRPQESSYGDIGQAADAISRFVEFANNGAT